MIEWGLEGWVELNVLRSVEIDCRFCRSEWVSKIVERSGNKNSIGAGLEDWKYIIILSGNKIKDKTK